MPPPRKRPTRRTASARSRHGAYAEAVRPGTAASAYRWPCPQCDCTTNLRGLLRETCSRCEHTHLDSDPKEKPCRQP